MAAFGSATFDEIITEALPRATVATDPVIRLLAGGGEHMTASAVREDTVMTYDSTADTQAHIQRVRDLLAIVIRRFEDRAYLHDASKLDEPEKALFDEYTPKLRDTTYGSDEYRQFLVEMKPALDHHYAHNSHHPEHYAGGVDDMSLLDLIEMLCDWKAATERHADGSLSRSLIHNARRFHIDEQLAGILTITARELRWLDEPGAEES